MTVGIAVPTIVASSAAMNIPVITPITIAVRRRDDIACVTAIGMVGLSLVLFKFSRPLFVDFCRISTIDLA